LGELVRMSRLLVAFRAALKLVHPSSSSRRMDRELLNLEQDVLATAVRITQDEQLKATIAIANDDQKVSMLVSESPLGRSRPPPAGPRGTNAVPDPETTGLPFGLSSMRQVPSQAAKQRQEQSRTSYNQVPLDEAFTFSHSVPVILRSIHARAIVCSTFALTQMELGNKFPEKKGSDPAALVMECLEECVGSAVIAMKDSENSAEEGTVEKTVQTMANISAVQACLPRLFATVLRGLFHIGLVRVDEVDLTFHVAEKSLKAADKACDAQVGSTYSLVYEICRTKIDSHLHLGLEHFNWVAKSVRETPNPYCENLIGFLKSVFEALGPMDEGSRAGLHFSCCGHVSERLVKHLAGKPGDTTMMDDGTLPPLTKIDAYGLKNLSLDCEAFEKFADSTGVPSLRDCFSELKVLTSVMLDKDLPTLLLPEHATTRRRKYPLLSLEKVVRVYISMCGCCRVACILTFMSSLVCFTGKYVREIRRHWNGTIHFFFFVLACMLL
jgi:exocyst complex component 6